MPSASPTTPPTRTYLSRSNPRDAQAVSRPLELVEGLFQLHQPALLAIDHVGLGLVQEVLVAELLAGGLEIAQQLVGLASQAGALFVDVDQALERQEHLGALHHGGSRDAR